MVEGLFMLLSLSAVMAIASFLAGTVPLSFSLSQSQLRIISSLGMGVLVGTSLIVIIPEGVDTLYGASGSPALHSKRSVGDELDLLMSRSLSLKPRAGTTNDAAHDHGHATGSPHAWVGISLIAGFVLMYLIDTIPQLSMPSPSTSSNIYSLSDLSSSTAGAAARDASAKDSYSTTLGLLIHAFADGIALGASSSMPGLSFVVFLAIMVHKAPAAFGLTTILLRRGLSKRQARTHLAAFSLAAPAGAIATWFIVGLLGGLGGESGEAGLKWWTGLILLFSGGTFLYVAMHTMQDMDSAHGAEIGGGGSGGSGTANGYATIDGRSGDAGAGQKSMKQIGVAVVGMILPAIIQVGHAH